MQPEQFYKFEIYFTFSGSQNMQVSEQLIKYEGGNYVQFFFYIVVRWRPILTYSRDYELFCKHKKCAIYQHELKKIKQQN